MKTETLQPNAARGAGHSLSFAESVIVQANGDLSDKEFRRYILMLAEKEVERGPAVLAKLTIEHGLGLVEAVRQLCDEIQSDYDTAMDDPENNVEGWKPTDTMDEFLHRSCMNEAQARKIVLVGAELEGASV